MTFRFLFDGRHFRSISLAKYMAVFCADFAANCTTGTTNNVDSIYVHENHVSISSCVCVFDIIRTSSK